MRRILLITANVGSLFEQDCRLHKAWLDMLIEALGSVMFIRDSSVNSIYQYDFAKHSYLPMEKGMLMLIYGLEESSVVVKRKFPKHFWPTIKWGRKGYMHTRWKINNNQSEINCGCVLRIEKKRFDYFNHKKLLNDWKTYLEDDKESTNFRQLCELPINFPPT
uniref:FLYWCH-type domain-containing protein n=1 Tax=Heterorhabditis bacteriophora TaxID=37862 RepID=A0A1I7WZX0_HETBA